MGEFDLIEKYFTWDLSSNPVNFPSSLAVGVGDDAAVLNCPANTQLATSVDTLISGVHFPEQTSADAIAHKALAVNLSDLAAMGATPAWFTLALTLPDIDHQWLAEFSHGLKSIAGEFGIQLIGGDTTKGPLSITINVMGFVDHGSAVLRNGANNGDKIYVTGTLGDAALGLRLIQKNLEENELNKLVQSDTAFCLNRLNFPTPRVSASRVIRDFATASIDVSDGFLQDLGHILKASGKGAKVDLSCLPLSTILEKIDAKLSQQLALTGGDDYELLFTVSAEQESRLLASVESLDVAITCVGEITSDSGKIVDVHQNQIHSKGYNHFHEQ